MGGPAHRLAIHTPGGWRVSVTPQRVNTFGAKRSDRHILLHHQRSCTHLCPCGRRTWSAIIVLTLGTQLLPQHVVSATSTSSPRVRILVLLLGLERLVNTDGATVSICCFNASASLLRDDLFRVGSGSDHAEAVLLAAFPSRRIPVVAATAYVVPFLLDPAAALGRMSPWNM